MYLRLPYGGFQRDIGRLAATLLSKPCSTASIVFLQRFALVLIHYEPLRGAWFNFTASRYLKFNYCESCSDLVLLRPTGVRSDHGGESSGAKVNRWESPFCECITYPNTWRGVKT